MLERGPKRLAKKAKRGFRGYPVATVALFGPDDVTATKIAVGIVPAEGAATSDCNAGWRTVLTSCLTCRLQPRCWRSSKPRARCRSR